MSIESQREHGNRKTNDKLKENCPYDYFVGAFLQARYLILGLVRIPHDLCVHSRINYHTQRPLCAAQHSPSQQ